MEEGFAETVGQRKREAMKRERLLNELNSRLGSTIRPGRGGFTLIELSIVLVVIGLVVGGVLVGQDLIRAAYVRAQISQIEKFNTAKNTFYVKYQALPGDMNASTASAYGFTITDASGFTRGQSHVSSGGTGDGNGLIEGGYTGSLYPFTGETAFFWVDMTYANGMNLGLIEGSFGVANGPYAPSYPGFEIITTTYGSITDLSMFAPVAKLGNGNYVYVYTFNGSNYFGIAGIPADPEYASFGFFITTATYMTPSLNLLQAYNIDRKIDDGFPLSGNVTVNYAARQPDMSLLVSPANPAATGSYSATTCYNSTTGIYATDQAVNGHGAGGLCALSFKFQ